METAEEIAEYLKEIIIHSEGKFTFEERSGIEKALELIQEKYNL